MVVYADVLICLNTVVNFLILAVTKKICNTNAKNSRMVLGAFTGAVFSLYIFLPNSGIVVESLVRLSCSALIVVISFGVKKLNVLIKQIIVFFAVTFLYAGLMLGLWFLIKPNGMVINNGIVYFNISPTVLIIFSLIAYAFLTLYDKIHKTSKEKSVCKIEITCDKKTVAANALIDSGHLLKDELTNSQVIIVEKDIGSKLFGHITLNTPVYSQIGKSGTNFRVIPYKTISGEGIMPAFRCEKVKIYLKNKTLIHENIIIGVISKNLNEDYSAIISPNLISEAVA